MSMTRSPQCSKRPGPCPAPARALARRTLLAALLAAAPALGASGCVAGSQLVPQRAELVISGSARILLKEARGGTLTFDVYNHTGGQMLIQRDAFFLSTPQGLRPRLPGGGSGVFAVQPGGVREISLRFDLQGLSRGDTVTLVCQSGLLLDHNPLPVEPIPLSVQ
jgi:hypothetical protein